ncbi:MAG TPA: sulfite exporter TauE/SafE family protein [Candidatus Acidoferrales bacterium]|nr:sulfite exporter TauE/SafE family protein [Candidatus Acidoferrales bacterium]
MHLHDAIVLFLAGAIGGAINAVAGGGSFISFPTLLFTGVPAVPANATNTFALWVGTAASGGAYRKTTKLSGRVMLPLAISSVIGGLAGALLLIHTPGQTFLRVLPWLLLGATLLFTFGRYLTRHIAAGISHESSASALAAAALFELVVAVYGGYFGGGIGIMNLAMLSALGMTNIHAMNYLKVILGSIINGVATLTFILTRVVFWPQALVMTGGALIGGYASAHYAQKLPQSYIRVFVIATGAAMTVYFFQQAYFPVGHR